MVFFLIMDSSFMYGSDVPFRNNFFSNEGKGYDRPELFVVLCTVVYSKRTIFGVTSKTAVYYV